MNDRQPVFAEEPDLLKLAGRTFWSRLLVGTAKYRDHEETTRAIEASGAEVVTVAVRRTNMGQTPGEPNLLDVISPDRYTILPNTAGCYDAESRGANLPPCARTPGRPRSRQARSPG